MPFEYLLFNGIIITASTLGVLLYNGAVWPHFSAAVKSIAVVGSFFVIWDQIVTDRWWYFSQNHTVGIQIGRLPIEEILFFIIVPWSCLVIWENLKEHVRPGIDFSFKNVFEGTKSTNHRVLELLLVCFFALLTGLSLQQQWWYTASVTGLATFTSIIYIKTGWFRNRLNLVFLAITSLLTLIFNMYLTARPIVIYNEASITSIRIGTIPIEDFLYGMILISSICSLYELFSKQTSNR